jgi:anti-sigma-K factor RskA
MRRIAPALHHPLAAGYVLGTLRGRARTRFEAFAQDDRALGAIVAQWENFLTPLAERVAPVEPPVRVWRAIAARITPHNAREEPSRSLWSSLSFWRLLGSGMAVAATVLLAIVLSRPGTPLAPEMMAVLSTPDKEVKMVVEKMHEGALFVHMVKPWASMDATDLELWVIPADGKPRSLGVVPFDRDSDVRKANLDATLQGGVAFAISQEPRGGSRTGAPTGPVLCSGAITRTKRA